MKTFQDLVNKADTESTDMLFVSLSVLGDDISDRATNLMRGAIITVLESRGESVK